MTAIPKTLGWVKPVLYSVLNIIIGVSIVFVNKIVFTHFGFKFVVTLTWIHTLFTWLGMRLFLALGFFTYKDAPALKLLPIAATHVGYIVLGNLSLQLNTVGFYQIMKIAITPVVIVLEFVLFHKTPSLQVMATVALVCVGIALATVTDSVALSNVVGTVVGLASTVVTALFQVWAGSKQKELGLNSSQLLTAYVPQTALMMAALVPIMDPVGLGNPVEGTLLGYQMTGAAAATIALSAVLGILVSLTTFLVIASTSSLTYNVVGHTKTVSIIAGGCLLFKELMPLPRLLGLGVAMIGIIWYTVLVTRATDSSEASRTKDQGPGGSSGGAKASDSEAAGGDADGGGGGGGDQGDASQPLLAGGRSSGSVAVRGARGDAMHATHATPVKDSGFWTPVSATPRTIISP